MKSQSAFEHSKGVGGAMMSHKDVTIVVVEDVVNQACIHLNRENIEKTWLDILCKKK